jgi:hypothetical protein
VAEHTPTPWKWCGNDLDGANYAEVMGLDVECGRALCYGGTVKLNISDEDRAFIVRAVNAHEDLLEALREAEEFVVGLDGAQMIWEKIRAAIARAEADE